MFLTKTQMSENQRIIDAIILLNQGKYSERRVHLQEMSKNGSTTINGFNFVQDIWCWVVFKPTDIVKNPEYKGEPLCKVIPRNITDPRKIETVLKCQSWLYI